VCWPDNVIHAAWTVAGSKSRGFIDKEQLAVTPRCHQLAFAAFELCEAGDPKLLGAELADDLTLVVVQDTAIPNQRTAVRDGDDVAEGCDAALQGHRVGPSVDEVGPSPLPGSPPKIGDYPKIVFDTR